MKSLIYLLLAVFIASSCDDDCDEVACFTPPHEIIFEITDSDTGENLFTNGTFNENEITVKNENNENVEFIFFSENEINLISLSGIGWNTGAHEYILSIGAELEIDFKLHTEERHKDCCTFFETIEFGISSHEFAQSNTTGIFTIKIEL